MILFLKHYGLQGANLKPFNQFLSSSTGSQFVSPKGTFYMDRDHLYFEYKGTRRQTKYKINIEQVSELPEQFNKQELYIDQEKINGNIYSRNWKKGDRIFPMGMKGSKLVSDVLKDAKIPDFRKKEICIISDDDNILFIYNLVVDRRKAASIFSQKILKISVENH